MNLLASLPTEIVIKILRYVEPHDLVTLCSMKELSGVIEPLVCVVCGDAHSSSKLDGVEHALISDLDEEKVLSYPLIVVVTYDLASWLDKLAALSGRWPTVHLSVFGESEVIPKFLKLIQPKFFSCIELAAVTKLTLRGVDLDPDVLRFPNLVDLYLESCHVSSRTKTSLNFPHLFSLTVLYTFSTIHNHLDYENTPLVEMSMSGVRDMTSWSNVHCPTLTRLQFTDSSGLGNNITSMENIRLENLVDLLVYGGSSFHCLNNVHFGKVRYLSVGGIFRGLDDRYPEEISIKRLDCPAIRRLELNFARTLTLWDNRLPKVDEVAIRCIEGELSTENLNDMDLGFLQNVKKLKLKNSSVVVSYASSLVELDFTGRPPTMHLTLPDLQSLRVDEFGDLFNTSLTKLRHIISLSVMKSPNSGDLHLINLRYPNLKEVVIHGQGWGQVRGLKMRSLETLRIIVDQESSVSFKDCQFDHLTGFELTGLYSFPLGELDLGAPLLNGIALLMITTDELVLKNFPKLYVVFLKGPIKTIKFENSGRSIELIELRDNDVLKSIKSDQKFKNLVKVKGHNVPFTAVIESLRTGRCLKTSTPYKGEEYWDWDP